MQTLGAHCLFSDPKKRWVWEGQLAHCLRVPRWGGGVCFLSGEPLVRRGNSSAATLRGPLTLHYLSLSCDLDSEPGIAAAEQTGARALFREGVGHVPLIYPLPFEHCGGEASLPPGLLTPFPLFLIALYFS